MTKILGLKFCDLNFVALHCANLSESVFFFLQKGSFAIYLYNGTLGTCVAHLGAVLRQLLCVVIFGLFSAPGHS